MSDPLDDPEIKLRLDHADLMQKAVELADQLTETLLPEELRAAGFRFWFDTTPIPMTKENEG